MDGMFYRPESEGRFEEEEVAAPAGVLVPLLLTIALGAVVVVAAVMLSRFGMNLTMPDEFPMVAGRFG